MSEANRSAQSKDPCTCFGHHRPRSISYQCFRLPLLLRVSAVDFAFADGWKL